MALALRMLAAARWLQPQRGARALTAHRLAALPEGRRRVLAAGWTTLLAGALKSPSKTLLTPAPAGQAIRSTRHHLQQNAATARGTRAPLRAVQALPRRRR